MGVALLDSSAVIAYLYGDDALHTAAVSAIEPAVVAGSTLAISAVTWAELLHGAHLGHGPQAALRAFIAELGVAILAVDADVAERAAALQAAYAQAARAREGARLRTPDALILGTAGVHDDIDVVICGDAKWSKVSGVGVRVELLREQTG